MAVTIKSVGPRGNKTYEVYYHPSGPSGPRTQYGYTDTKAGALKMAAKARAEERSRKNPAKAIRLKNFTGTVKLNPNKTVSVVGRKKKGTKRK